MAKVPLVSATATESIQMTPRYLVIGMKKFAGNAIRLNEESSPAMCNKHSKHYHPSRKKPHKVACDGHSRSQQTESDREDHSAEQEVEKDDRLHDRR